MWSNDATVGIEARGDPRTDDCTPTADFESFETSFLQDSNSERGQCEFERTHSKHRFVSSTSLSVLYAQRGAARARAARARFAGITGTARAGERGTDVRPNCLPPHPLPTHIHKF